jgi:hypothetical protein
MPTLTFYSKATAEDGYAFTSSAATSFATLRAGGQPTGDDDNDVFMYYAFLTSQASSNTFSDLARGVVMFDTSSIGASATITSATLSVRGSGKVNTLGLSAADGALSLVAVSPSSTTGLTGADFNTFGTTRLTDTDLSYSSFSTSGFNVFTLNAAGLANINKTGVSKFGFRFAVDTDNGTPNWVAERQAYFSGRTNEYAGDSSAPVLTITFEYGLSAQTNNANPYADGKLMSKASGGSWTDVSSTDLYFVTYTTTGATTKSYSSQDPSTILETILDNFNDNGGVVTYTAGSIDTTGTTVSYTFNTQTILECINKILELAPEGWYWYVDPATNLVHFHQKNSAADHTFTLGKDIKLMRVEKRTEGIVNTVYFTGGDTGGGTILYKKFADTSSVGLYGIRAIRYTDERVTSATTATTIANRILNSHSAPEIRIQVEIADSNVQSGGYDIETITIGDVINIRNVQGNTGSSLWDVALWDQDRWDYNIAQVATMYLQIVRIEYYPDRAVIMCSTLPPDVAKRIEDINRNLVATQTASNPSAPS